VLSQGDQETLEVTKISLGQREKELNDQQRRDQEYRQPLGETTRGSNVKPSEVQRRDTASKPGKTAMEPEGK
jgi:hypothetical protein